jgi:hypothetical protein
LRGQGDGAVEKKQSEQGENPEAGNIHRDEALNDGLPWIASSEAADQTQPGSLQHGRMPSFPSYRRENLIVNPLLRSIWGRTDS